MKPVVGRAGTAVGVLALTVVVALAGCKRRSPSDAAVAASASNDAVEPALSAHATLRCDFQEGERLAYRMTTAASLVGDMAALGPGFSSNTDGIDQVAVHEVELTALETSAGPSTLVQYAQRSEGGAWRRALVRVARSCKFEDIGVPPEMPVADQNQLVDTLATLEFVGATSRAPRWTAEQNMPFGRARIAYRAEPLPDGRVVLHRRVAEAYDMPKADGVREAGNLRGWVAEGKPWLVRLELERQVLAERDGMPATITERIGMSRGAPWSDPPRPLDPKGLRWTGQTLKPFVGHNRSYPADAAPPGLAWEDQSALVQRIVRGLAAPSAQALLHARRLHVYAMRARTDLARPLVDALLGGRIAGRGVGALLLGLTDAGTPEAEAALVAILEAPSANDDLRRITAMQMHRQVAPTRVTVAALLRAAHGQQNHERVRHSAWASLGALVGYGRLPLSVEAEVRALLAGALANEQDRGLRLTLLSALGNTRHASLVDDVERFTGPDHDGTVRVHAMVVLERMGAAPSPTRILELAGELHDARHLDRLARLAQYGDLVVSDRDIERALSALTPRESAVVRTAAIQIIARRLGSGRPDLGARLAAWYAQETDPLVKREIGRHVPAPALRGARLAAHDVSRRTL